MLTPSHCAASPRLRFSASRPAGSRSVTSASGIASWACTVKRATNTGATAVIDARGRVSARLAPFTQGVLDAPVQARHGVTPFAWWASRFGLWPPALLAALAVAAFAWGSRGTRRDLASARLPR